MEILLDHAVHFDSSLIEAWGGVILIHICAGQLGHSWRR